MNRYRNSRSSPLKSSYLTILRLNGHNREKQAVFFKVTLLQTPNRRNSQVDNSMNVKRIVSINSPTETEVSGILNNIQNSLISQEIGHAGTRIGLFLVM
jgi:hypothetical protein